MWISCLWTQWAVIKKVERPWGLRQADERGLFGSFTPWKVAEELKQQHKQHNKVHTHSVSTVRLFIENKEREKRLFVATHPHSGLHYKVSSSIRWLFADFSLSLAKVNCDIITCTHHDRQHCEIGFVIPLCLIQFLKLKKTTPETSNSGGQSNPSKWRPQITLFKVASEQEQDINFSSTQFHINTQEHHYNGGEIGGSALLLVIVGL